MYSRPKSFHTSVLRLVKGQSHFLQLPRGTVIRVAAGSVALIQSAVLDACALMQRVTVPRGDVYCVEVPTWVQIVAQADADVVVTVTQQVPLVQALREAMGAVLERFGVRRHARRFGERCAN